MIDYAEKRGYIRMPVQCPVTVRDRRGDRMPAETRLLDLSASGLRFFSPRSLEEGDRLQVTVSPENPITPPLEAEVAVVRCEEIDNGFDIAASIELIAPVQFIGD
mgnify:CR=1 FL=1